MSSGGPKMEGGGSVDGWFLLPRVEDVRSMFREAFDWQDYARAGAGGLVAWSTLAEDIGSTAIGAYGIGVATAVASVAKANGIVIGGVASFARELVNASLSPAMLTTAFATASAELRGAGLLGVVLATAEVILLLWIARKGWEVAR